MKMDKNLKEYRRQVRLIKNWYEKYQEYYEGERDLLYAQMMDRAMARYLAKIGK